MVSHFEGLIPGYNKPSYDNLGGEWDDSLVDWFYKVILTHDIGFSVEKCQFNIDEINDLSLIKQAGASVSDDGLYDDEGEVIGFDNNGSKEGYDAYPYENFIKYFNAQLEPYNLALTDLWHSENPTYICISTKDKNKVDEFYQFLNKDYSDT